MIIYVFNKQNAVVLKITSVHNVYHVQVFQTKSVIIMVNVKEQALGKEAVDAFVIKAMKEIIALSVQMDFMNLIEMKVSYFALSVMLLVMVIAKELDLKIVNNVKKGGKCWKVKDVLTLMNV